MQAKATWLRNIMRGGNTLDEKKDRLLKLLVHFDALGLEDDKIKNSLHDLFFDWQSQRDKQALK